MHKEFGIELISTADSHYPNRDAWKDRELYKRLGWLGKGRPEWLSMALPIDVAEVGYELYPKNGDEMWQSYKHYSQLVGASYDDKLIASSIERTYDIAHNRIESFTPDNTVRLPEFVVPTGFTADAALAKLAIQGLKDRDLLDNEYINRLRHEVDVIPVLWQHMYLVSRKWTLSNISFCFLDFLGKMRKIIQILIMMCLTQWS
jgi:DNA polymerase III alpha subunit